jgi:hypothetical protein
VKSEAIERETRAPADNNVQDVLTTIDEYACGAIRALAQDPPQNAVDAKSKTGGGPVRVVYRVCERALEDGTPIKLLTITDSGTTGLDGPILSSEELAQRQLAQGQLVIEPGENWAAWEAMRYTKSGQDSLGSRGQGKYAYLWHSAHPVPGSPEGSPKHAWRMIILYDTLLPDGEYRLGVRFHNPQTQLLKYPFLNEEAIQILQSGYVDKNWDVPLQLEPLSEPGTRVIIPFLSADAQGAITSGEFYWWLTAEWWRKIQTNQLAIDVVAESGERTSIGVPDFWDVPDLKALAEKDDRYLVKEQLKLPSDRSDRRRVVKRIVLFQDDQFKNDDLIGPAQFNGVQILRGGQWITTLEMNEFADEVPRPQRPGFRGFVELDRQLEREFRAIESPAHDGFKKNMGIYQELKKLVNEVVEEFAVGRGWSQKKESQPERGFDDVVKELSGLFVSPVPGDGGGGPIAWTCTVDPVYPAGTPKVEWDDRIRVYAHCARRPSGDQRLEVRFRAVIIRPDGSRVDVLNERSQKLRRDPQGESSTASADFGELAIKRGWAPDDPFREPGRYSIEASCYVDDEFVASGRAKFYVAADPAPPPGRPVTIQLQAFNAADGGSSIDYGGELVVVANARNYTATSVSCELAIAIEDSPHVLASREVTLPANAAGVVPTPLCVSPDPIRVVAGENPGEGQINLEPGPHRIVAALERDGEILASATALVVVGQADDKGGQAPFLVAHVYQDPTQPRWKLEDPGQESPMYTLVLSNEDPIYRAVRSVAKPPGADRHPKDDFGYQVVAEGLVEWAFREYRNRGDEGQLRLVGGNLSAIDQSLADRFDDGLDKLKGSFDNPNAYGEAQRELAAIMLEAARKAK